MEPVKSECLLKFDRVIYDRPVRSKRTERDTDKYIYIYIYILTVTDRDIERRMPPTRSMDVDFV